MGHEIQDSIRVRARELLEPLVQDQHPHVRLDILRCRGAGHEGEKPHQHKEGGPKERSSQVSFFF